MIPKYMRGTISTTLRCGHLGIEGTIRRAKELVYWPGM